jgi:RNA polymerase sigma-32 factor
MSAKMMYNVTYMSKLPLNINNGQTIAAIPTTPIGSIDAYVYWVNQIPVLTAEEELALTTKFHLDGDLDAARQLVLAHLRFVAYVAKNYLGYGLSKADLIQEGTIGLMKAVKRFDPTVGVRLVSFAVHWIKAEIHEFVLRNWRIVKIATTKAQRKLFFNLRRSTKKLNWFSNAEVLHIARELNVKPKEVRIMEARMSNADMAFDSSSSGDDCETNWHDPINYLEANTPNPSDEVANFEFDKTQSEHLTAALNNLDQRSREILQRRWLKENKATLHELATEYNISAERVRQIEETAMKKLKKEIKDKR